MSALVELTDINLLPVIEVAPWQFSKNLSMPEKGPASKYPEEWEEYWRESLLDAGITELTPITAGSFFVSTHQFNDIQLQAFLRVSIMEWGGLDALNAPEFEPFLYGGFAFNSQKLRHIIEPSCCGELKDLSEWKRAASLDDPEWEILWIGHPWLSMKYEEPYLILSEPHESDVPIARWNIDQKELMKAVERAETELRRFSKMIEENLAVIAPEIDSHKISQQLVGLLETPM